MAIDPKKTKKTPPNKSNNQKLPKLPKLPAGAKVKVIEITPRSFLFPILLIALLSALVYVWNGYTGEKIHYNDAVGLNTIRL